MEILFYSYTANCYHKISIEKHKGNRIQKQRNKSPSLLRYVGIDVLVVFKIMFVNIQFLKFGIWYFLVNWPVGGDISRGGDKVSWYLSSSLMCWDNLWSSNYGNYDLKCWFIQTFSLVSSVGNEFMQKMRQTETRWHLYDNCVFYIFQLPPPEECCGCDSFSFYVLKRPI